MLNLEFEQLTIRKDGHFKNFYTKFSDITNSAYMLEKKYLENKIVTNTLRSYVTLSFQGNHH